MSSMIMWIFVIAIIYIAYTKFKGPRNENTNQNGFNSRSLYGNNVWNNGMPPVNPDQSIDPERDAGGAEEDDQADFGEDSESDGIGAGTDGEDAWELPENNTDVEAAAEEVLDAGINKDLQGAPEGAQVLQENRFSMDVTSKVHSDGFETGNAVQNRSEEKPGVAATVAPPAQFPETTFQEVVIDSEVRIDARMPSDPNTNR